MPGRGHNNGSINSANNKRRVEDESIFMKSGATKTFVALETDLLKSSNRVSEAILDAIDNGKDVKMLSNNQGVLIKDFASASKDRKAIKF